MSSRFRAGWSKEDSMWVGFCLEFPGVSHLDDTFLGAIRGIKALVEDIEASVPEIHQIVEEKLSQWGEAAERCMEEHKDTLEALGDD